MIKSASINHRSIKTALVTLACLLHGFLVSGQMVEYTQQVISIRNASLKDGEKQNGGSGILFTAEVQFKYSAEQVLGALDAENQREYHFFLHLEDMEGHRVFYPATIPDKVKHPVPRDEYVMLTAEHTGWQYLRIFIPYNQIRISEGKQQIKLALEACNDDGTHYFRDLYTSTITIQQPPIYIAKVVLTSGTIKEKEYDMPGKKIPIIGLFVGGGKSGQGLPDAAWKVQVGSDMVYESPVINNSYQVEGGTASFRVAKGDGVKLVIVDEDFFLADEVLGEVSFYLNTAAGRVEKNNYAFGNITSSNLYYQQTSEPDISDIHVTYAVKQYQGVTGIEVKARYIMKELLEGDAVALRPVFRDAEGHVYVPEFIKLVNIHLDLGQSGMLVDRDNGADEQTIFIPHYACLDLTFPGMDFFMEGYDIQVQSAVADELLGGFRQNLHDVKVTSNGVEECSYKGYWGLKVPLEIAVPEMYYDDLDFSQFTHSITVKNSKGFDITDSVMVVSLGDQPNLRNFQLRKVNKSKILFIPYARCNADNQPTQFTVQYKTRFWKTGILIGEETLKFGTESPNLTPLEPFEVSYGLKRKNIETTWFKIWHGDREIYRSEKISRGKHKQVLQFPKHVFCMYDDVTVEVMGTDYFGNDQSVYKYAFTPYLLSRNIFPPYDTPKGVRGFHIVRKRIKSSH